MIRIIILLERNDDMNDDVLKKYSAVLTLIVGGGIYFGICPAAHKFMGLVIVIACAIIVQYAKGNKYYKKIVVSVFVVMAIFSYIGNNIRNEELAIDYQNYIAQQKANYEENYNSAIEILNKKYCNEEDYKNVCNLLASFKTTPADKALADVVLSYKDAKVLYKYADAMATYEGHDSKLAMTQYKRALDKFEAIPPDYSGTLADVIAKNRLMVQKDYIQAKGFVEGAAREAAAEKAANIAIGEGEGKITQVLGQPETINTTKTGAGERKQYVYSNNRYVYTVNGIITGMQNIEHQY